VEGVGEPPAHREQGPGRLARGQVGVRVGGVAGDAAQVGLDRVGGGERARRLHARLHPRLRRRLGDEEPVAASQGVRGRWAGRVVRRGLAGAGGRRGRHRRSRRGRRRPLGRRRTGGQLPGRGQDGGQHQRQSDHPSPQAAQLAAGGSVGQRGKPHGELLRRIRSRRSAPARSAPGAAHGPGAGVGAQYARAAAPPPATGVAHCSYSCPPPRPTGGVPPGSASRGGASTGPPAERGV
jgi:hypothetical protein